MSDDFYRKTAEKQSSYTLTLPTGRGNILDCNFTPLVNESYEYIAAVLPTDQNFPLMLQHAVGYSEEELAQLYSSQKPFLCRVDTYQILDEHIQVFPLYKRYTDQTTAAHVIGYLNEEQKGISGIEKAYDEFLTQSITPTTITYMLNGSGVGIAKKKPEIHYGNSPNNGVVLTIDKQIQQIAENVGSQYLTKGAIVVMECDTGKLRAVCSFPSFSPNDLQSSISDTENAPMINRAFTPVSVGSTFKIVTSAAALISGYESTQEYECTGAYQLGTERFHCHLLKGHGILDLKNALMVSCNPFFINLSLTMNPDQILKTANDLSFGKQYELAPGLYTQAGTLPLLEQLINPGQIANLSFGQGALSATTVQLAQMASAVANGGNTPTPILVEGITKDGETMIDTPNLSSIQAMPSAVANQLKEYLTACVMEREGQNAKPSNVSAGGKTATAQTGIYIEGVEQNHGGFVGFFPAEDPKYVVAVLAENAETGNENASPVFREIAEAISILGK